MKLLKRLFESRGLVIPEPWQALPIEELPLMAMDFELTSLDTSASHITSVGWVKGMNGHCDIGSARHFVIRTKQSLCQSPTIHGLTHEHVSQGKKLMEVIDDILRLLTEHVCVFHHAALDIAAIKQACKSLEKDWPGCMVIDTIKLSKYQMHKKQQVIKHDALTLNACRQREGLPLVNMHNALDDAMATLELFYAFQHEMKIKKQPLKALKHTGAVSVY